MHILSWDGRKWKVHIFLWDGRKWKVHIFLWDGGSSLNFKWNQVAAASEDISCTERRKP